MIDEAEQIVYRVMHYGSLSKEHQSVSHPPSISRERKRESRARGERESQLPSPCQQPLPQTGRATPRSHSPQLILLFLKSTEAWQSPFSNMGTGVWNSWGHCALSREGAVHRNVFMVWWDLSHGPLVWQWTYNYGYPHSRTTLCHCGYQETLLGSKAFTSNTKIQVLNGKSLCCLSFFLTGMSTVLHTSIQTAGHFCSNSKSAATNGEVQLWI